jgi:hypothetical protein
LPKKNLKNRKVTNQDKRFRIITVAFKNRMKLNQRSDLFKIGDRKSIRILSSKAKEDEEDSIIQKDKIKE